MSATGMTRASIDGGAYEPHSADAPGPGAEMPEANFGRHQERGAGMVEFALVFILLFTVITLIIQGGFFFSAWLAVTNGAREGARFAAPCMNRTVEACTEVQVEEVVRQRIAGFLAPTPEPSVDVVVDPAGRFVTVTVLASVGSVGPLPLDLPVYGVSRMRLEMSPP